MKLHPLSIPYRTFSQFSRIVFFVVIGTVGGSGAVGGPGSIFFVLFVAVVALAAILGWQTAYYRRFEYEITPDTFDIRSGVISRRNREIPLGRIQNVDVSQNVVHRILKIASVNIETAGGSVSEATLNYVGEEKARRIRKEVRERKKRLSEGEKTAEGVEPSPMVLAETGASVGNLRLSDGYEDEEYEPESLYEISGHELLLMSTFSIDFRLVAFAFFLLSFLPPEQFEALEGLTSVVDFSVLPFVVLGLLVVVVLWVIGFATTFSRYYGFGLSRVDDTLGYERGLFNRYSGSIPVDKIQTFTVGENVLKRRFDYSTLSVDTAGYSPSQARDQGSEVAVPFAKYDRVIALAEEIEGIEVPEFERPPKRARRRYAFRYTLLVVAVLAVLFALTYLGVREFSQLTLVAVAVVGFALSPVAAHLKWRNRGYYLGDEYVATRNGFWNRTTVILPYYRVQNVIESSTVLQRRWGIATVTIDTASTSTFGGNEAKAVDIGFEDAERVREGARERLQESLVRRRAERKGQET